MTSQQTGGLKPTRRTLVKGAAWSVPVVAMGAPAFAEDVTCSPNSCPPECLQVGYAQGSCKCPGSGHDWSYQLGLCFTNVCTGQGGESVTINVTKIENNAGKELVGPLPVITVPPTGAPACSAVVRYTSSSSASKIVVTYTINGATQTAQFDAPPDCATCDFAVVPNLAGMTETQASTAAQDDGFQISVSYDGDAEGDSTVTSQSPAAGVQAATGSTITVVISGVDPNARIQNGTRDTGTDGTTDSGTGDTGTEGQSARQASAGDATVVVPNLFGKSVFEAGSLLSSAGLTMKPSAKAGTVTAQSPEAGASVAPGSTVEVTVESARGGDTMSTQDAASVEAPPPAEATRGDE